MYSHPNVRALVASSFNNLV